jgi:hypothetical protein
MLVLIHKIPLRKSIGLIRKVLGLDLVNEVRTLIQFSEEPVYIPKIKERLKA